jgi:conjugative transfer region protein (TIGR03748 family)
MLVLLNSTLPGCTTTTRARPGVEVPSHQATNHATSTWGADLIPVTRHGRYTLAELVPEPAQRDLLQQVVEVTIAAAFNATVGDAIRHVLLSSGYQLCDTADAAPLYALPLPAAHMHLGPLMLRDALLTLAGPAWKLSVDDQARQVCFQPATPKPGAHRAQEKRP